MTRTIKIFSYILSAILLLGSTRLPAQNPSQENSILVDAVQLYSDGQHARSLELLKGIVSRYPSNDAAWYYKGLCELALDDKESAKKSLSKAVELDPSNYWYRDDLAMAYAMDGETDLAIVQLEALAQEYPKKTDIYYSLVNSYMRNGDAEKALGAITEIENMMGKSDGTVMTRFNILRSQQKNEEAFEELRKYCDEYSSPQVLAMLGDYEMSMYNDSTALGYYNEALLLDSSYSPAKLGRAEVFRMTRKYPEYFSALRTIVQDTDILPEAKSSYLEALMGNSDPRFFQANKAAFDTTMSLVAATHPTDTSVLNTVGLYYYRQGDTDKSLETFHSMMQANPDSKGASATYLQLLAISSRWETLRTESYKAAERFPEETSFLDIASTAEYNLKNYKAIIDNDEKIIRMAAGDSAKTLTALSSMGDVYHMMGNAPMAYKCYDRALKINPDYAPVLNNYAYYLSEEGGGSKDLKKAYKMSKKTIEQEPDNATYLDTFAWILHLQGKDLEAKPFFKHAMLYGGKESKTILLHYCTVLENLGEKDLAKVYKGMADKITEDEE